MSLGHVIRSDLFVAEGRVCVCRWLIVLGPLQIYVKDVHLIKGRKYDLRLYVAATSSDPLRLYVHRYGLPPSPKLPNHPRMQHVPRAIVQNLDLAPLPQHNLSFWACIAGENPWALKSQIL